MVTGAVSALVRSARFWTLLSGAITLAGAAWVQSVAVARWMASRATVEALQAVSDRVAVLERDDQQAKIAAFNATAAQVGVLRSLAGEGAARVARRDPEGTGRKARERFDELVLRGTSPVTALEVCYREYGVVQR